MQSCKIQYPETSPATFATIPNKNQQPMETNTCTPTHIDKVKNQLNKEFIGLEEIIDQFFDAITPWCTMSESQSRPLVVNLWGMTGVGKTSLIKRFLELWNTEEIVIQFNMGSKNYSKELLSFMENMHAISGKPSVIIFDEFQHAKTISDGKEVENPMDRMIWQLLDDGKFLYTRGWFDGDNIREMVADIELCLDKGVKVEKGKVVQGWHYYKDIMEITDRPTKFGDTDNRYFLTNRHVQIIYELMKSEFKFKSVLKDYLLKLDGQEILQFVRQLEVKFCTAREMDFSKSLIFVIGNLDEAFDMSGDVSADHDPDIFYRESKKITFSKIKEGLKERFRMEEIARLGNIHLIYPSLNSEVFKQFIEKELREIEERFNHYYGHLIEFTPKVHAILFEEGVTATQGFRPLRSTIRYLIESSLANLFQKIGLDSPKEVLVDIEGDDLIVFFDGIEEGRKTLHLPVRAAKRQKLNPQTMALTAVHEAGHVMAYTAVFGMLPKHVSITSSDFYTGGYVSGEGVLEFDTYDMIFRDVIVKMAGKKAEELVFGKDHQISFGCKNDIQSATRILVDAARTGSLPGIDMFFENPIHGNGRVLAESSVQIEWVKEELVKASQHAERILKENEDIYQMIIKLLLDRLAINSDELFEGLVNAGANLNQLVQSYPAPQNFIEALENYLGLSQKDWWCQPERSRRPFAVNTTAFRLRSK